MAETWYPTKFSEFYVNGKSYYKLTGIAIHYTDVSLDGKIKQLSKNWTHLLSGWFLTKLWTKTLYLFMDCVTTRLQMEIGMFFSVLDPEKCKEIGKIGEIPFGGPRTEKNFRENDQKTVVKNPEIFPRKCRFFWWSRQNLSSGPRVGKVWEPLG